MLPNWIVLDPILVGWLQEDIGRGDQTTQGLGSYTQRLGQAEWIAKAPGIMAGLTIAARIFYLLDPTVEFHPLVADGEPVYPQQSIARLRGPLGSLLTGERAALNLTMRLSGIASLTRQYVDKIAHLHTQLVDTRKTTPGLRLFEKYATAVGGAKNHRLGLDDSIMVKDNHIAAAGGIGPAIDEIRSRMPYPLKIEVETETLEQVKLALEYQADIIMLDNMQLDRMIEAVRLIRQVRKPTLIEASGNITLETISHVAETGVDFISSSAPITQSNWLDLSMRIDGMKQRLGDMENGNAKHSQRA